MATRLDYNDGKNVVPEGHFRIQPSSFADFFSSTAMWFREKVYDEAGFEGSTSTVLGTCVHFYAADMHENGYVDVAEIEKYIEECAETMPDLDVDRIREQYPIMGATVLSWYSSHEVEESEEFLAEELLPGIWVGGSIDALEKLYDGSYEVVDYKTTSDLTAPKKITNKYDVQLKCYAWLYSKKGYNITSRKIVYITNNQVNRYGKDKADGSRGNKLPDKPSVHSEIRKEVTEETLEQIEGMLYLAAKILQEFAKAPYLRPLLAQDFRLNPSEPINYSRQPEEISDDDI